MGNFVKRSTKSHFCFALQLLLGPGGSSSTHRTWTGVCCFCGSQRMQLLTVSSILPKSDYHSGQNYQFQDTRYLPFLALKNLFRPLKLYLWIKLCSKTKQLKRSTKISKSQKRFQTFLSDFSLLWCRMFSCQLFTSRPPLSSPFVGNHWDYQKKETNKSLDRPPKGGWNQKVSRVTRR